MLLYYYYANDYDKLNNLEKMKVAELRDLATAFRVPGYDEKMRKGELVTLLTDFRESEKKKSAEAKTEEPKADEKKKPVKKTEDSRNANAKRMESYRKALAPQKDGNRANQRFKANDRHEGGNKTGSVIFTQKTTKTVVVKTNDEEKPRTDKKVVDQPQTMPVDIDSLNSGKMADGLLEITDQGYGFIRDDNFMPGEEDVYVAPSQIKKYNLKTGDILKGPIRINQGEKYSALLRINSINGLDPEEERNRIRFEKLTPIFPDERINLETPGCKRSMRMVNLFSPIGKGQRGMVVSPPKAGKTTLIKDIAKSIIASDPNMNLFILLIDERPEEVTDIKDTIKGEKVKIVYSTFDELPEHHTRVSEMTIERAKRLVELGQDVTILLDSITRLSRAYNLTITPSGRTLSGGLDPAALNMPKKFFGAARNLREGGSLTIIATALVDTGSRMDDMIFEEFKGTGNMELVLDRKLSERRIFPAIDLLKSSTRRDDLLLKDYEFAGMNKIRKYFTTSKPEEADLLFETFKNTENNLQFLSEMQKLLRNAPREKIFHNH